MAETLDPALPLEVALAMIGQALAGPA